MGDGIDLFETKNLSICIFTVSQTYKTVIDFFMKFDMDINNSL